MTLTIKFISCPIPPEAYVPGAARKGMEWQYYTGDCSDPAVQRQAKLNFVQGMTHALSMIDPFYCQREKVCNIENVKVSCGKSVEVSGGKKKRSIVRVSSYYIVL